LEELKTLIETTPRFYLHFTQMFGQVPWRTPYHNDLIGQPQIRDYEHLLQALNLIVTQPPTLRSLGIPIYAILAYPLGTTRYVYLADFCDR
jgi:phosphatidylserine decarboxylase